MSRKIIINSIVNFEPEKKKISGGKGIFTLSASAALCFELLIENVGNLVTHDQFYDYAWRRFGMEPTSTSLYQNISTLRKSLRNSGMEQDIIRTMPRRGFLLSPLTEISRIGPERITEDDDNEEVISNDTPDTNDDFMEKNETTEMNSSRPLLPIDLKTQPVTRRHNRMRYFLACASGIAIGTIAYFIQTHMREGSLFTPKSVYYKGCIIYSNKDNNFQGDEMFRLIDGLNLRCENNRYAYITSYRFSDRISLIVCRNPLGDKETSKCHSFYYIKNMRK